MCNKILTFENIPQFYNYTIFLPTNIHVGMTKTVTIVGSWLVYALILANVHIFLWMLFSTPSPSESSGRKNVLRKLLRMLYRRLKAGFLCVDCVRLFVCLSLREFWLRLNEMHKVWMFAPRKAFLLLCGFCFSSLENYFGLGTTNVKGKTDHSVSLRWNKEFWTFPKRRVFFGLFIRFICELISPFFAGLN